MTSVISRLSIESYEENNKILCKMADRFLRGFYPDFRCGQNDAKYTGR